MIDRLYSIGIVLLNLDDNGTLHEIRTMDMNLRPVALTGDIMALTDDVSKTVIYNWKTNERAYLDEGGGSHHDRSLEVVFTPSIILVIRVSSISLYTRPPLLDGKTHIPLASHSFSRAYGVSVPTPALNNPLSVLISSFPSFESNALCASVKLYSLSSFPQKLTSNISYRCRAFLSIGFVLSKRATAVSIRPQNHDDCETLVAAVYPGPFNPTTEVRVRDVFSNPLNNWTTLDYEEDLGRVAVGSWSENDITVIHL